MSFDCHVLLAEDKPVNQEVGRAMLESFGCRVEVASNGREVLNWMESTHFDMVFMDCEMPLMDGFEATRILREREKQGVPRTPVIALTAHIMDEDRQRCIASGMDDYLGKPFRMHELSDKLERWTKKTSIPIDRLPSMEAPAGGDGNKVLDPRRLESIKSLGVNGAKMLAAVIGIYMNDTPILVENLQRFLELRDTENMGKTAHALGSTSANLGAATLTGICRQVEEIARAKTIKGADLLIDRIRAEYEKVREALEGELQRGI